MKQIRHWTLSILAIAAIAVFAPSAYAEIAAPETLVIPDLETHVTDIVHESTYDAHSRDAICITATQKGSDGIIATSAAEHWETHSYATLNTGNIDTATFTLIDSGFIDDTSTAFTSTGSVHDGTIALKTDVAGWKPSLE